jgi:hypothetical protein
MTTDYNEKDLRPTRPMVQDFSGEEPVYTSLV